MRRVTGFGGLAALLLCLPPGEARAQADRGLAADVDSLVRHVMAISGIPGLAIAVVHGADPVLVKGYGFADLERRVPVTVHTVFYIASVTKSFTGLTLALMADRGTVDLDAPLPRYLPDARWADDVHPDSITLRQLLTHTHGLEGSGPVVWRTAFTGVHTNELLKRLLRAHGPSGTGRAYRYSNLGYNVAGIVIDDLTGGKWQDALATHVMGPLGMTRTTAYVSRFDSVDLAMPYTLEPGGPRRAHYAKTDANMQAAGGLVSTAADLAKWLEAQLNLGRVGAKQILPERVIAETQRPQVTASGRRDQLELIGYGLGWLIGALGSDTVLIHGGGFSAFRAVVAFLPRHKVGVAVMTNEAAVGGGAIEYLAQYVLDRARDSAAARQRLAQQRTELPGVIERARSRIAEDRSRRAARPQVLHRPLEAYTGSFENAEFGTITWTVVDGRLRAAMGVLRSVAEVYDRDSDRLRVELEPGMGDVVQFRFENDRATSLVFRDREYLRR